MKSRVSRLGLQSVQKKTGSEHSGECLAPEFLADDSTCSENSAAELLTGYAILLAKVILATGIGLRFKIQGKLQAYTASLRTSIKAATK